MPTKRKPFILEYSNDAGTSLRRELSVRRVRAERLFAKLRNQYLNARLLDPQGRRVA